MSTSHDTPEKREDAAALRGGLVAWIDRASVKRAIKVGLASLAVHTLVFVLIILLNFRTNIVDLEPEWSEDALVGVGTWSEAYQRPDGQDEARGVTVSEEVKEDEDTPRDDLPKEDAAQGDQGEDEVFAEDTPEPEKAPEPEAKPEPKPEQPEPVADVEPKPDETPEPLPPLVPEVEKTNVEETAAAAEEKPSEPAPRKEKKVEEKKEEDETKVAEKKAEEPKKKRGGLFGRGTAILTGRSQTSVSDKVRAPLKGEERDTLIAAASQVPGLQEFGPGNARLIVLLHTKRVRGTEYEESVRELLLRFPDYKKLLSKSGVEPVERTDAVLIATNNPARVSQTFLAIRHPLDEPILKTALNYSFSGGLQWETHRDRPIGRPVDPVVKQRDPRVVFLPEPDLFMLLRPEILPQLDKPSVPPTPDDPAKSQPASASVLSVDDPLPVPKNRTLLEAVQSIEYVEGPQGEEPVLFVTARDVTLQFGAGIKRLPSFQALSLTLSVASGTPRFLFRFDFADAGRAAAFLEAWPAFVESVVDQGIPGVEGVLTSITFAHDGEIVYAEGTMPAMLLNMALGFGANMLPE